MLQHYVKEAMAYQMRQTRRRPAASESFEDLLPHSRRFVITEVACYENPNTEGKSAWHRL